MSITHLKALGDKDLISARKFPAAPAITKFGTPKFFHALPIAD